MRTIARTLVLGLSLAALATWAGCHKPSKLPQSKSTAGASVTVAELPADDPPVTDDEALAFGQAMEKAMREADGQSIGELVDWRQFAHLVCDGFDLKPSEWADVQYNFRRSYLKDIVDSEGPQHDIEVLRVRQPDERRQEVVIRVRPAQGGLNYEVFRLVRSKDGGVRAADMKNLIVGEWTSQVMRRNVVRALAQPKKGIWQRLTSQEDAYVRHCKQVEEMGRLAQSNDPAQALAVYYQLPSEIQRDKLVQVLRLGAAQRVSDEEYTRALDDISRFLGEDPNMSLTLLDGYCLKKKYDEALACLDRLDGLVGGDPFLNILRTNLWLEKGDLDSAERYSMQAVEALPDKIDAHWARVTVALRRQDFDTVGTELRTLSTQFQLEFDDLRKLEEYREFVRSPQYQAWIEYLWRR